MQPLQLRARDRQRPRARSVLRWAAGSCVCAVFITIGAAHLAGLRMYRITSESMDPAIESGALILTQRASAEELSVGDIITTRRDPESRVVTHRIIAIDGAASPIEVRLQGDANADADPATYPLDAVQRYVLTIF